jgi:hypothetical protein
MRIWESRRISSSLVKMFKNDASLHDHTNSAYIPTSLLPANFYTAGPGVKVDWVLVRKCVNLEPQHGGWGQEESMGDYFDNDTGDASIIYSNQWCLPEYDLSNVSYASSLIYDLFYGTSAYDHLANYDGTVSKALMQSQIADAEQNHDFATVLYLGHGMLEKIPGSNHYRYYIYEQAPGYLLQTHEPVRIYDYQIYEYTVDNHHFVFLWACVQGNEAGNSTLTPHGMPYAWTRQENLSPDGYGDDDIPGEPDSKPYAFIGFEKASPMLSQMMGLGNNIYRNWLLFFYYFALNGYTINGALDAASESVGCDQGWDDQDNPLSEGENYWWWLDDDYHWGRMRIYGNGGIYLPT